jgi:glycosyltransferase involved in cell wall biosynthesis
MRIVFVTPEIAGFSRFHGGLGSYLADITDAVADHGHTCDVFVASDSSESSLPSGLRRANLRIIPIKTYAGNRHFARFPAPQELRAALQLAWTVAERVEEAHAERPYDLIHSSTNRFMGLFLDVPIPILARFDRDLSYIRASHGLSCTPVDLAVEMLEWSAALSADGLYAGSRFLAGRLKQLLGRNCSVLCPPAVRGSNATASELAWLEETGVLSHPALLFVGALSLARGCHLLADALPRFFEECPLAHLHLLGENQGSWERLLETAGDHRSRLHYHGFQSRNRVFAMMRHARAVLVPDAGCGQINTAIEAMSLGVPVIAVQNASGEEIPPELLREPLVRSGTHESLASVMSRVVAATIEQRRLFGDHMRSAVVERCDPEKTADRFASLCRSLVSRGSLERVQRSERYDLIEADLRALLGSREPLSGPKQDMRRRMIGLAGRLLQEDVREVVVYGAGEAGQLLADEARKKGIRVLWFVDRDSMLRATTLFGLEILSLDESLRRGARNYAVGSVAFSGEIVRAIEEGYGKSGGKPSIFASS